MFKTLSAAFLAVASAQAPAGLDPSSWTPEQLNRTLEYYAKAVEKRARKMQVDISCAVCHRVSGIYSDQVQQQLKKVKTFEQSDMLKVGAKFQRFQLECPF